VMRLRYNAKNGVGKGPPTREKSSSNEEKKRDQGPSGGPFDGKKKKRNVVSPHRAPFLPGGGITTTGIYRGGKEKKKGKRNVPPSPLGSIGHEKRGSGPRPLCGRDR